MKTLFKFIWYLPRRFLSSLILIYQHTLSPDHSWLKNFFPHGYCQFQPTCSDYGRRAITKYGALRGSAKTVWRILRCNPCSHGGIDEP